MTTGPRTGGAPGRGIPITFTRQSTSREILELDWHYPVASKFADHVKEGQTSAAPVEAALPREVAFAKISDENHKPLLVLRECIHCKGTEHALFSRTLNNEKTMLLAQWFYCVKLPPNVLSEKHPFRKVFEGENPPHVFLSLHDGSEVIPFDGRQTQTELWKGMTRLIEIAYEKKPKPAIRSMLKYLSKFDMLDGKEQELRDRVEKEREKGGPNSSKFKKLRKELDKVEAEKAKSMKLAKAVCDLKLKVVKCDSGPKGCDSDSKDCGAKPNDCGAKPKDCGSTDCGKGNENCGGSDCKKPSEKKACDKPCDGAKVEKVGAGSR